VRFIDEHKDVFGVEPICRVLTGHGAPIAPSTYYAAKSRPASARAVRDEQLKTEIARVWKENYEVYGADKVWLELNRQGIGVARCTTERLMRELGLQGVRRGRKVRTTVPGKDGHRAGDLLRRDFTAPAPNRRWVADFTYVAAWSGIVYVAFVVDVYSRAIVGWSAATHKRAKLVLDALQMALWRRDRDGRAAGPGLVHHSDAGSQGGFNRPSQHLHVEVCGWGEHGAGPWLRRGGRRCVRRGGRRWRGGSTGSGSGRRSRRECQVRTPALRLVCPQRSARAGSATAAGSGRSA
jgi:putative transposase